MYLRGKALATWPQGFIIYQGEEESQMLGNQDSWPYPTSRRGKLLAAVGDLMVAGGGDGEEKEPGLMIVEETPYTERRVGARPMRTPIPSPLSSFRGGGEGGGEGRKGRRRRGLVH